MKSTLFAIIFCFAAINTYAQWNKSLKWATTYGISLECNIPAVCVDEYEYVRRATCRLYVNGYEVGTGTLINNTALDHKPYVLTSAHVLDGLYAKYNEIPADSITFLWGFEEPTCAGEICNNEVQKIKGATIVACDTAVDMALLLMPEAPSVACRPYWAGWNMSENAAGPYTCYHHPKGDAKKVSVIDVATPNYDSYNGEKYKDASFWFINGFAQGVVEHGSSGSALLDADGLIIGALTGGDAIVLCDNIDATRKYYWMLSKAWNTKTENDSIKFSTLAEVLDPIGSGATSLDGLDFVTADGRDSHQYKSYDIDSDISEAEKQLSSVNTLLRQAIKIDADTIEVWSMRFASYDATCATLDSIDMGIAADEDSEPIYNGGQRSIYLNKVKDSDTGNPERYESVLEFNFDKPLKIAAKDAHIYVKAKNFQGSSYVTPAFVATTNVVNEAQWFDGSQWRADTGHSMMVDVIYSVLSLNDDDPGTVTPIVARNSANEITYAQTAGGIIIEGSALRTITIYDFRGCVVLTCDAASADVYNIDVNGLGSGLYIINTINENGTSRSLKFSIGN
ncbi:MAG: trypsin-like peptidase domain-containing protein [Bacteroidales bacterium]|nr:trypsin-like peptidase domain-containing protein [Bacteroidales bacterium]